MKINIFMYVKYTSPPVVLA